MTTNARQTSLGVFGDIGGFGEVEIVTVHGHTAEIRRLWAKLDGADSVEQRKILDRLNKIGAVRRLQPVE